MFCHVQCSIISFLGISDIMNKMEKGKKTLRICTSHSNGRRYKDVSNRAIALEFDGLSSLYGAFVVITSTSLKSTAPFCGEGGGVRLVT